MLRERPPKLCPRLRRHGCKSSDPTLVRMLKRQREFAKLRRACIQPLSNMIGYSRLWGIRRCHGCGQCWERHQKRATWQVRAHSVCIIQCSLRFDDDHSIDIIASERQRVERTQCGRNPPAAMQTAPSQASTSKAVQKPLKESCSGRCVAKARTQVARRPPATQAVSAHARCRTAAHRQDPGCTHRRQFPQVPTATALSRLPRNPPSREQTRRRAAPRQRRVLLRCRPQPVRVPRGSRQGAVPPHRPRRTACAPSPQAQVGAEATAAARRGARRAGPACAQPRTRKCCAALRASRSRRRCLPGNLSAAASDRTKCHPTRRAAQQHQPTPASCPRRCCCCVALVSEQRPVGSRHRRGPHLPHTQYAPTASGTALEVLDESRT